MKKLFLGLLILFSFAAQAAVSPIIYDSSCASGAFNLANQTCLGASGGGVTSVSGISPILSTGGATPAISCQIASGAQAGCLDTADWTTFNSKQNSLTFGSISTGTAGITVGSGANSTVGPNVTVNVQTATGAQPGLLDAADWNTFNGKQNALTFGNFTDAGTDGLIVTNGVGSVIGTGTSIAQHVADTTHNGYLASADWNTFNSKQPAGNYITALTGDGTATGPGSAPFTLATVNANVGTFGSSTSIPAFTVNAKGLITAASGNVVIAPAGTLTGATLAANVLNSSLTSVGAITSGTWNGAVVTPAYGGTGLSTLGTGCAIVGEGTSNVHLVCPVASGDVLTDNGPGLDPSFQANPGTGAITSLTGAVTASGPGAAAVTIGANVVANSNLAQAPANTIKGNNTGSTANEADLTEAQVTAMLTPYIGDTGVLNSGVQGAVPAPPQYSGEQGEVLGAGGSWVSNDTQKPIYKSFSMISYNSAPVGDQKFQGMLIVQNGANTYAIAGGGTTETLSIYNITDQANPQLRGSLNISGTYGVCGSSASWPYIFVPASGARTLSVVNISNPNSPTVTATYSWAANTTSIYACSYSNGLVFMAGQSHGLGILDVGNGVVGGTITAPVLAYDEGTQPICSVGNSCKSFGVAVDSANQIVYSTDYSTATPWTYRQLKAYSYASSITSPALLQNLTLPANTKPLGISLNVGTHTAFVTDANQNVMDIVDTTNVSTGGMSYLAEMTPSGGRVFNSGNTASSVNGSNYAYIPSGSATASGAVDFFDLTNRSTPSYIATATTTLSPNATSVFGNIAIDPRGGYIYAADYGNGTSGSALDVFTMPFETITAGMILGNFTAPNAVNFTGNLAGDVSGTQSATSVNKINGTSLAGLSTGILKNTTGTGVPSIAVGGTDYSLINSLTLTVPSWLTVTGSPLTSSGTLAITGTSEAAGLFLASPIGSAGPMAPRPIAQTDLPATTITNGGNTNYTILSTDQFIRTGTALTAPRTYTLPACTAGNIGERHRVKNINTQTFNLTLAPNGTDTIDYASNQVLPPGNAMPVICAVATEWDIEQ